MIKRPSQAWGWVLATITTASFLGALPGLAQAPLSLSPQAIEALQAAVGAVSARDWDRAAALYQRVIEEVPDQAALHNNLGVVERRRGNLRAAIAAYRRTLELDPTFTQAYTNLAVALLADQQWSAALAVIAQAEAQGQADHTLTLYQGLAHEKQADWTAAATAYQGYIQEDPSALGFYRLAIAHWQSGDGSAAAEAFQRASQLDPAFALYTSEAGLALAYINEPSAAASYLAQLPADWSNPVDFMVLARLAHQLDLLDLAEEAIIQAQAAAIAGDFPPEVLRQILPLWFNDAALISLEQGDLQTTLRYLREATSQAQAALADNSVPEDNPDLQQRTVAIAQANLAEIWQRQNRLDLAVVAGETALAADPSWPQAYNNQGVTRLRQDDIALALALLQEAVALDPDYWQAHRNLAVAYAHAGDRDQANIHYQAAMDSAPTLADLQRLNQELVDLQRRELPAPPD